MAQREGSVYLYLFVVAMMLFVLVTVGFVMNSQELERRRTAMWLMASPLTKLLPTN